MRNRNDKIARAAHIKPRTEGTSNEISLSVLGAASQGVNALGSGNHGSGFLKRKRGKETDKAELGFDVSRETSKPKRSKRSSSNEVMRSYGARRNDNSDQKAKVIGLRRETKRKLWQDTPSRAGHQASNTRAAIPRASVEDEIKRRKKARRRNRIIVASSVSVAIAAALVGAAWLWHVQTTEQQGYEAMLVEALQQINEADNVVMKLDEIMNDPFSSDSKAVRAKVTEGMSHAQEVLSAAEETAKIPSENLFDGQARKAANECISSINARQVMLTKGAEFLAASQEAIDGTSDYSAAWQAVLEADSLVKDASKLTSSDEVEESKSKYEDSLTRFKNARSKMEQVQVDHPQVQLTDVLAYIDKRMESMGYAIDSNNALLDKDKEEAIAKNDAYNASETQAAELALKLPAYPAEMYQTAFSEDNAVTINAYKAARSQAGSSDTVIRAYLGAGE